MASPYARVDLLGALSTRYDSTVRLMLKNLRLRNIGPAPELSMALGPRLNVVTGDNGLGKTLLLDAAWWALTRTWPATWSGRGLVPDVEGAVIDWEQSENGLELRGEARFEFAESLWNVNLPTMPPYGTSLVVYVRVDGGVSIHDPYRLGEDFRLPSRQRTFDQSNSFQFREVDIWDGLDIGDDDKRFRACEGLVRDVVRWVEAGGQEFERLAGLVEALAGAEPFRLARKVARVYVDDARDFPFVEGPAGLVPVAHAPAGLRRILGIAYLLVWAHASTPSPRR